MTLQVEWLPIVMQGSFSEIYVADCRTLRLLHVNQAARENLGYAASELDGMHLLDVARMLARDGFDRLVLPLHEGSANHVDLETVHSRKNASSYPVELRLFHCASGRQAVYIAIGNDLSARRASADALSASETRYRAIVSNTPGLVYQFMLRHDDGIAFPYLGEGCHALLGLGADDLRADPALFLQLILPEDRPSYLEAMRQSAADMKAWNWEGRIWVEKWHDIKWINLRATPRALPDDCVQWEGIMNNITAGKLEQEEIRRSRAQLAELSAHVESVKEKERTRIAREIHDDIGGNLTAIKMALARIRKSLPAGDPNLADKTDYVDSLVDRTIEAIHRISADLRPSILDFGIVAAIGWQAGEFEKNTGIPCAFSSSKKDISLHPDQATALFRIFQEALTNIAKHAGATQVTVRLLLTNRSVKLLIADNGRGIGDADRMKPKSFGIRGMMERAIALGGQLTVSGAAGGGTELALRISLAQEEE